jgi:hypothetical protein
MSNPVAFNTALAYESQIDIRSQEIIRLLKTYFKGFREVYYGHRPIGNQDIVFPCAMVEPGSVNVNPGTVGKFHVLIPYQIFFYIQNNDRNVLPKLQADIGWGLAKLFSNNALGDLGSGNTKKFKGNPGFWIDSTIKELALSATYAWSNDGQPSFARAGILSLQVEDVIIV